MDLQTLEALAEIICGDDESRFPVYRKGTDLSRFFQACGISRLQHDGSTRKWWTLEALKVCSGNELTTIILRLASPKEYRGDKDQILKAVNYLNKILNMEGYKVIFEGPNPKLVSATISFNLEPEEKKEPELKPLPPPAFLQLGLEVGIGELLSNRWQEAQLCVDKGAYLASLILMGSLLEGMLLGAMQKNPKEANLAPNAPKEPSGKVKHFANWSLSEMIDVAHALNWIDLDVKRFSHALREFRNLVHPYQQLLSQTVPDSDTCKISWLVVQAAVNDLAKTLKLPPSIPAVGTASGITSRF